MNAFVQGIDTGQGYGQNRCWQAELALEFSHRPTRTVLDNMHFKGPLRVQRPFYPEQDICHTYLLHPPGGMVSGDQASISIKVNPECHALLTTPSAGKVYKADSEGLEQQQCIDIEVDGGVCEWLPQETIIFDRANANLKTNIKLRNQASFTGWEMISLGRPAGDQPFLAGRMSQQFEICLDERPLVWESLELDPELRILSSRVGLNHYKNFGSLYWAGPKVERHRDSLDQLIEKLATSSGQKMVLVATHKPDVLIVRGMSHCAEVLRNSFMLVWAEMRVKVLDRVACYPRIWST